MGDATKHDSLMDGFSKDKASELVNRYEELSFLQKPHHQLGVFFIIITILTMFITVFTFEPGATSNAELIGLMVNLGLYALLTFFVFLNHRWAMIAVCFLYLIDKVFLILAGQGFLISHVFFGFLILALTWRAVLVASALIKRDKSKVEAFD